MGTESLWEPYTPVRPESPCPPSPPAPPEPPAPSGRSRVRLTAAIGCITLVLLLGGGSVVALVLSERLGNNVTRVHNAFGSLDEATRPAPTGAMTFLLVGTDSRSETTPPGVEASGASSESDVVMLARIAPDRRSAAVVSIPRDSLVDIPERHPDRIATAYAAGGPALLIRTVESLTGQRVDHFAVIDFAGFRSMVDALGGINLDLSNPPSVLGRGPSHLDGAQALLYVREHAPIPNGDRARRQQNALHAILAKAASNGTLSDPVQLYDFLDAASRSIGVDDTLSNGGLRALGLKLTELGPDDVTFVRAPVAGIVALGGGQFVVHLDDSSAGELWTALRDGTVSGYVRTHSVDAFGSVTK